MANHCYISSHGACLRTHVKVGDVRVAVQFTNGQFKTEDEALATALDSAIANGLGRAVSKVDRSAAEAMAKRHMAHNSRSAAIQGGMTAEAARVVTNEALDARDEQLAAMPGAQQVVAAAAGDMQVTEKVQVIKSPVVSKQQGAA